MNIYVEKGKITWFSLSLDCTQKIHTKQVFCQYKHKHTHTQNPPKKQNPSNTQIKNKTNTYKFRITHHLPTGLVHWHHAIRTNRRVVECSDHYYGVTQALVLQIIMPGCIQRIAQYQRCLTNHMKWNKIDRTEIDQVSIISDLFDPLTHKTKRTNFFFVINTKFIHKWNKPSTTDKTHSNSSGIDLLN